MPRLLVCLLAACLFALPATAHAEVPEGAEWHEEYFSSGDGTRLHADVLRPKGLPENAKTPVLLTVSPYTNHSVSADGDFDPNLQGPSDRFADFTGPARIFERGYTYVVVDLRGTGGSGGCTEWGGKGERADVKAAVEWAASQPWSTGKVGMFGKSYDGWTGLMGMAERPKGLAAVLSMEPVYSGYRYFWTNGVRISNTFLTPASFNLFDIYPGNTSDNPEYFVNSIPQGCQAANTPQESALDDESLPFWEERNLIPPLKGSTTPLFLTQGFLEDNTKPDGAFDVFRDVAGPKRAWFGQFRHVRGWEKIGEEFAVGRDGFLEEAIGFFDHHVRGDGPPLPGPTVAVQDSNGSYRGEEQWPPADVTVRRSQLNDGSYTDDGGNEATGSSSGAGIWSVSQPLSHRARLAGEPVFRAVTNAVAPRANLVVNVYDVSPEGKGVLVTRGATIVRGSETAVTLYGQDWVFEPGQRIGVLVTSSNAEWWQHIPTQADVEVTGASIELPFLTYERDEFLSGAGTAELEEHKDATAPVPASGADAAFVLPPALTPRPEQPGTGKKKRKKLRFKVRRKGKRLVVRGRAPKGALVSVQARRGKRVLDSAVKRAPKRRFRVTLRAARATKVVVRAAGRRVTRKVPTRRRAR